jgi:hypothetical protein
MNKIVVQLPANRDYAGRLEIQNAAGQRIAGPFHVCGRADDESAQNNKNPGRNPLLPFGDIPFGEYQIVKIMPSGPGTAYHAEEFGSAGIVLMRPKLGDAALADANGRFGFFIQGGARTRNGLLRPTPDGSLRLADRDQRRFTSALRKAADINCLCLVVSTAKVGGKVAVAKIPVGRARRNTPASLLLASSVIASTVTGVVRQAWVRTMFHAAGTSIASGLAFVAADHASAQSKGDYTPTGGAADQLNTVEHHSQDATHAATDEQAHDQAAQGFDTASPVAPPVDLHDKQGIVTPDAASGGSPPAPAAGLAPGSPMVTTPEPSTTPEETQPTPSTQPENENMPEEATPAETPPDSSTAPENQATEPATPANVVIPAAAAAAGAALGSAMVAPSGSTTAPTAQEPAAQAIIEHDNQDLANPTSQIQQLETGKAIPLAWLNQFQNNNLKDWIANNVICAKQPIANKYGISAGDNGDLLITPSVFNANSCAININLMAFELGKVFWLKHTDSSGNEPPAILNLLNRQTVIEEMRKAKYGGVGLDDLTADSADGPSQLGIIFRAALLNLQPENQGETKDWNVLRTGLLNTITGDTSRTTVP